MLWVGSIRDAETRVKLDVSPPQHSQAAEIPVHGQIEGIYRGSRDELEFSAASSDNAGSEITAAGKPGREFLSCDSP